MVHEGYANGCTQRLAEDADAFRRDAGSVHREIGESECVGQKTTFGGPSSTAAESAVVNREDMHVGCGSRNGTIALGPST